jgi:hypothetical protein
MREFLTAVWLEAAYQEFRRLRGIEIDRPKWFSECQLAIRYLQRRRAYN